MDDSVSIIVPCYNASSTIIRCLDSIEAQEYNNFQIVIVDDCSTDDTVIVIHDYINKGHNNIILVENKKNCGPSFSRKHGIEVSDGDIVAFVDSDDYVENDYISSMIEKMNSDGSNIVVCDYFTVDPKGNKRLKSIGLLPLSADATTNIVYNVDSMCLMLIRRELFQNISFPDLRNGEDMAMIPQLFVKAKSISYVNKPLYNYVYSSGSLSNGFNTRVLSSLKESYKIIHQALYDEFPLEVEYLSIRNYLYGALLHLLKNTFDRKTANEIISDFERIYPCWWTNKYIIKMPSYKRVFLTFVRYKCWTAVHFMCFIHKVVNRG